MIWDKEETLPREELRRIQEQRLKEAVSYIYERVLPYREKMEEAGVKPEDIRGLKDLPRLPFTFKTDFRDYYPTGLFAVSPKDMVRFHASSGTTGKPTVVGYTKQDLGLWKNNVARIACMGGAKQEDIAQIAFGYGTFTGALGLHAGLEEIGTTVIPMSSGNTKKQMMFMKDLETTILVATPSYALHLGEEIRNHGWNPETELKVRIGLFGGEGMTEGMRKEMKKIWGEHFFCTQNYGMSELCGPGVAGECECLCGMHINEDWFIPEVVDPDTGEVLLEGEKGELVITCLGKEALPLIRYRTGDLTRLFYEPCACGRTTVRMENLSGRVDDMLVIRGVNVFPSQIEEVLLQVPEIGSHYEILVERKNRLDVMTIRVELIEERLLDSYERLSALEERIKEGLQSQLGLSTRVRLVAPSSLQRFEGKAKRVTDLRKEGMEDGR